MISRLWAKANLKSATCSNSTTPCQNGRRKLAVGSGLAVRQNIALTHCLSLTDTLWVKSEAEDVSWAKVNLYENKFDDYLSRRGPVIGSDYVAPAKAIMTPAIRACVEEIRETELVLECDERFSEKRLATMNMIKNVQCDRILGIDAKWKWA